MCKFFSFSSKPKSKYDKIYYGSKYKMLKWLFIAFSIFSIALLVLSIIFANSQNGLTISTQITCSNNTEEIVLRLPDYIDVIVNVIISIDIALVSIDATIFIFSKSALDRFNDENRYIGNIVSIHKENTIRFLYKILYFSFFALLVPVICHSILSFNYFFYYPIFLFFLVCLSINTFVYILLSRKFIVICVSIEDYLREIIRINFAKCSEELDNYLRPSELPSRLKIIGDWNTWDDNNYEKKGRQLCGEMLQDQFINCFQKAEKLLIPDEFNKEPSLQKVRIVTTFQERQSMLRSSNFVDTNDLTDRDYFDLNGNTDGVLFCITNLEEKLDFFRNSDKQNDFFKNTEDIYNVLKEYCNLLISERFTRTVKGKNNKEFSLSEEMQLSKFAEAYYTFYIRILSVFVSSVYISDYSFNDTSLNYANFYNSTLENISLYGASFFRTVFSRTIFKNVIMDLSEYEDVDFFSSTIIESSLNNSKLDQVRFDRASVEKGGFDACVFTTCQFIDSNFSNCNFNNTIYKEGVIFKNSDFVNSKFRELEVHNATFKSCSFTDSEFFNWSTDAGLHMESCDFSKSIWSEMELNNWKLYGSVFRGATLAGVSFLNSQMVASDFSECNLSEAIVSKCNINNSDLKKASLFNAQLENVDLSMADLSSANAVNAKFSSNCSLKNTNCDDADFSKAEFIYANLEAARLYNCSFTRSIIQDTNCKYILADKMQFTFATCANSDFSYGSLSNSNMTSTSFSECKFIGADLSEVNATKTTFEKCILLNTDFSDTRFVKANFHGACSDNPMIITNCDFSNCKFEKVSFKNVRFINCIFTDSIMIKCKNSDGDLIGKNNAEDLFESDWKSITFYNKPLDAHEE